MLSGDVDQFYRKLRRRYPEPPDGPIPELNRVREIAEYYGRMEYRERELFLVWARKEQSGIGIIPATLSGIPLIGLLFVPLIQQSIDHLPDWAWIPLWSLGTVAFVLGLYVHQRQHAYTTLHIQILQHLCDGTREHASEK